MSERDDSWRDGLTAENVVERIKFFACPNCGTIGEFDTYRHPTVKHIGLRCTACNKDNPLWKEGVQWLRSGPVKRSNDIQAVMDARGHYCWLCSATEESLKAQGIGMQVHHTLPFAFNGDKVEKIPLCAVCHEIARALQRHHGSFRQNDEAGARNPAEVATTG